MDKSTEQDPIISAELADEDARSGLILDNYRLLEKLAGHDGYETYSAEHQQLGRRCVVKLWTSETQRPSHHFERLMRGAKLIAPVRSSFVNTILEVAAEPGPLLVRSYIKGTALSDLRACTLDVSERVEALLTLVEGLLELHEHGMAHGNLLPNNCILSEGRAIVLTDFAPQDGYEAAARDIRGIGLLLREWVLDQAEGSLELDQARMRAVIPCEAELHDLADRAARFDGPYSKGMLKSLSTSLSSLEVRPRHILKQQRSSRQGVYLRGVPLIISGIIMLCVAAVQVLGYFVIAILMGWQSLGPICQMALLTVAPPLIFGVAMFRSGLGYVRRLKESSTPESEFVLAVADESPASAPTTTWKPGKNVTRLTQPMTTPSGELQLARPSLSQLRLIRRADSFTITRRFGNRLGIASLLIVMVTMGIGISNVLAVATFQRPDTASYAVVGLIALLLVGAYSVFLIMRLILSPDFQVRAARQQTSWKRLLMSSGCWFGTERASIDSQGLRLTSPPEIEGARVYLPWSEIWDIKPGSESSGVEIASNQGQHSFAVGAPDLVRQWIAMAFINFKRQADSNRWTDEELTRVNNLLKGSGRPFWRRWLAHDKLPKPIATFCSLGLLLFPPLFAIELVSSRLTPSGFPPDSVVIPLEVGVNQAIVGLSTTCIIMVVLGFWRLRQSRRSGRNLVQTAYWSLISCQLGLWILLSILMSLGVEMVPQMTLAVNLQTLVDSFLLLYLTVLVIMLLILHQSLDLTET